MKTEVEKPYMMLKFGRIKYADFTNNELARRLYEAWDKEDRVKMSKVIEAYNGDFHLWWEDKKVGKLAAIAYVLNYVETVAEYP